jgi:PAS domain S-box-containing protein
MQKKWRILIVEDDPDQIRLFRRILDLHGFPNESVLSGFGAISFIKENRKKNILLILDYNLPDMNARELLSKLKDENIHLPFIVFTGHGDEKIAVEMMKQGALDYIVKENNFVELLVPVLQRTLKHLETEQKFQKTNLALLKTNRKLLQEIHKRKKISTELSKEKEKTKGYLDIAGVMLVVTDRNEQISLINSKGLHVLGYDKEDDILGKNWFDVFIPDKERERVRTVFAKLMAGEIAPFGYFENYVLNKNGEKRLIAWHNSLIRDSKGKITGALSSGEDITTKRFMEEAVVKSKIEWEETFDTINEMITIHDKNFNIVRTNKAAENFLGLSLDKIYSQKCYQSYHGTDKPPAGCASCETLKSGKPATIEIYEPHLDKYLEIKVLPRINDKNEIFGVIHIVNDISKRKKAQEKIESQMGQLDALRKIDQAIASSLELNKTLNTFVNEVVSQLKVDAAAVLLFNPENGFFEFAAGQGFKTSRIFNVSLKNFDSFAGHVAGSGQKLIVCDLNSYDGSAGQGQKFSFANSFLVREEGFRAYCGIPLMVKGEIKGVLEIFQRRTFEPQEDWLTFLETLTSQATIAIDKAILFMDLQNSRDELIQAYDSTIEGWSKALDFRDKETEGHSERVCELTVLIASVLGLENKQLIHIKRGAFLHDIGKLGVPDSILLKPGKLTREEEIIMQRHPGIAYEILSPIAFLRESLDIPLCHHEKWDGSGYPQGLKGEEIPLSARIFAVVDVWDALRSDRPYRKAWDVERTLNHIQELSGSHFDPAMVEIFMNVVLPDKMKNQGAQEFLANDHLELVS